MVTMGNSVDNTWGDWTIQEGENDSKILNNRNGKRYKFNLRGFLMAILSAGNVINSTKLVDKCNMSSTVVHIIMGKIRLHQELVCSSQ